MGEVRMGPHQELVLMLRRSLGIREFVETGTFRGDTAAWASTCFAGVTTMELSDVYHSAAVRRFRNTPNVRALRGNSLDLLRTVGAELREPALFWLDAHWSGLDTAGQEAECPVLQEIQCISSSDLEHVIMVDDARLFCAPPPRPHRSAEWPNLVSIVETLSGGGRRYVALVDDVFTAVPVSLQTEFVAFLQNLSTERHSQADRPKWWRKLVR